MVENFGFGSVKALGSKVCPFFLGGGGGGGRWGVGVRFRCRV